MSIEFLAGFVSGLAGLFVGSPFDIIKTIQQNGVPYSDNLSFKKPSTWFTGLLAPTIGLGFMNAILFWSFNLIMLSTSPSTDMTFELSRVFAGGFFSGICVCLVSVPTELVKVRAQTSGVASTQIIRNCLSTRGLRGLFSGFSITIARDAIGYGFYFMAYQGLCQGLKSSLPASSTVLLAGGLAGCISWFSIFPLDTIKTRIQAGSIVEDTQPLLSTTIAQEGYKPDMSAASFARAIYRDQGMAGFFTGLWVAMFRAFLVNAVIFWVDDFIKIILAPK